MAAGLAAVSVVGLGNPMRRDDGAALELVRRLGDSLNPVAARAYEGEPIGLLDLWAGAEAVVLVDAVRSGAAAGAIHRVDVSTKAIPVVLRRRATHTIGVAEALELGRTLGRLPRQTVFYGIEGADFALGVGLSPPVLAAMPALVEAVRSEARGLAGLVDGAPANT